MDKITLKNMKFFAYHGVFPEEQDKGQNFYIDAEMYLDLKKAGISDNLEDTVDYSEIYGIIKYIVEESRFRLIEKLSECLIERVMQAYPSISEMIVRVRKPEAPINGVLDWAEVEIKRNRNEL